jgi:hypothetical protein
LSTSSLNYVEEEILDGQSEKSRGIFTAGPTIAVAALAAPTVAARAQAALRR